MSMKNALLASSILGLSLVGLSVHADETRQCLDELCLYQSLPSMDALLTAPPAPTTGVTGTEAPHYGKWGFDPAAMDRTIKPGDDFYNFAQGAAIKNMTIPADRSRYGSFNVLTELSENRLKVLVEGLAKRTDLSGDDAKIAALYNDMMNTEAKNALDVKPIAPRLAAIAAISTKTEMAAYLANAHRFFGSSLFGVSIGDDRKNPGFNTVYLSAGGTSLPDRDYYLKDSFKDKKTKFEAYVTSVLGMAGFADPAKLAHDVVEFETKIADTHWTRIEMRNTEKTYNPMAMSDLKTFAPGFDWDTFLSTVGVSSAKTIVLTTNTAIAKQAKVFDETPLETIKAWEAFTTIDQSSAYLSDRFSKANWGFYAHDLSGAQEERALWKRSISVVEGSLGEPIGKAYVKTYFPADSKTKMVALVAQLRVALKARIEHLSWMTPETKAKALEKLSKFGVKIGYPDVWRDYSKLEIKPGDLVGNLEAASSFAWDYQLSHLGKPIDRTEWGMTPQTVNAYYSPTRNEIVFPAAILQPPFFDPKADMAVNFGGIGGVIGHEMTHGFDDQGRKYDGNGGQTDWWQAEDSAKFDAQAKLYGAQYDTYEPIPGAKVQGGLTMGENIADLGGVLLGLDAYHLSLKGKPAPVIGGFTGDQRVFLGWSQVWRAKSRDDALKQQVTVDPHSPAMFRVIGPMRNVDAWYKAFNVKPGDKYYLKPEDRVRIW